MCSFWVGFCYFFAFFSNFGYDSWALMMVRMIGMTRNGVGMEETREKLERNGGLHILCL